jgi:hypothetical protein
MSIEAMNMALEFVSWLVSDDHSVRPKYKAPEIAQALRQAIEQAEKQEPVAWLIQYKNRHDIKWGSPPGFRSNDQILGMEPLYTAPPKREWVGLTDEDFYGQSQLQVMAMKYAEAKLKEKNGG